MLPLERAMSGVFHRDSSQGKLSSQPSRMNMTERREFSKTHTPEWVTKGLVKRGGSPLGEAATGFIKGGAVAYMGKALLAIAFGLLGRRKKFSELLETSLGKDTMRFAVFYGLWNGLIRFVCSYLYTKRKKDDRYNAAIAGAIAGLALLVDDVERRRLVAIYAFVRAMSVLVKGLSREGRIPYFEHAESVLFGLVNGPIIYSFLLEPDVMDPGYYKWICNMGAVTHEGLGKTLRDRRTVFQETGVLGPFCSCQPHYHSGSCVGHCTSDWFHGLIRASKIYAPVHILPLLLFKHQKLINQPQKALTETALALLYSCMFLSTYVFNVKFTQCMLRNFRQMDTPVHAILGGFLTGFACLLERPSRVSELMLYCVPKSGEVMWNFGVKHWGFKPIPYFELPLFMIAGAILMSTLKEDLKSTYYNALKFAVSIEKPKSSSKKSLGTPQEIKQEPGVVMPEEEEAKHNEEEED